MTKNEILSEIDFSLSGMKVKTEQHLADAFTLRPIIAISTNHNHVDENMLTDTYANSIRAAGGIPLIIPMGYSTEELLSTLGKCDGLVLSGGGDVHSLWFGEQPHQKLGTVDTAKDYYDITLIQGALKLGMPILGICRGLQLLNVVLGGTLIQDLPSEDKEYDGHTQTATRYEVWHTAVVNEAGRLRSILDGAEEIMVNSYHHQAIKDLAPSGTITASALDGVIEAVDFFPEHNAMGVQWHPEALACEGKTPNHKIFKHLIKESEIYSKARMIHHHILTLDSHVDTPSIFVDDEEYSFMAPSQKVLVNHPRMTAGQLDVAIMAAYLSQGELTEEAHDAAHKRAIKMLDRTHQVMQSTNGYAETVIDLNRLIINKKAGRKSILKAVENGYAIGNNLDHLQEFKEHGIKYMTLCHNGDNLICDSASKSLKTHGGLSSFGIEVVKEMNRLGIAIDISHASDDTIIDVLKYSSEPIIASHSSCKALCDHPRNLSDELMKKIAEKGGVIQLCMYAGFVHPESNKASFIDFVNHIEHAIRIAGIEHVGIGTDFDGGGEVIGCRDSSALIQISIELLRRNHSPEDLRKIWGENLLRVLK